MAERQPLTSEQRKEIAKRRREKAAAAALEPELAAIDENPVPEQKIGGTKPPKRKTGPSIADLNPMEEILINREEANKQLQEVELMRRRMVARAEDIERRALDGSGRRRATPRPNKNSRRPRPRHTRRRGRPRPSPRQLEQIRWRHLELYPSTRTPRPSTRQRATWRA